MGKMKLSVESIFLDYAESLKFPEDDALIFWAHFSRRPISANPGLIFNPRFFSFCSKAFSLATCQPHEFLSARTELNFRLRSRQARDEVTRGQRTFLNSLKSIFRDNFLSLFFLEHSIKKSHAKRIKLNYR